MNIEYTVVHPARKTGVMLTDDDGNQYPETVLIEGYHVNTTQQIEAWAEYQLTGDAIPSKPACVYAGTGQEGSGVTTYFYCFPDEATFEALNNEEG